MWTHRHPHRFVVGANLPWRVDDLGLNRPVILGEFAGRSARVSSVLEAAQSAGYEGAFVWSVLSDDEHSAYSPDVAAWVRASGGGGRA